VSESVFLEQSPLEIVSGTHGQVSQLPRQWSHQTAAMLRSQT
jgi:hypothetical protein